VTKERVGLYPGTFDPMTLGHLDIIQRATKVLDRLVIGVAINLDKGPLFDLEERVEMVQYELGNAKSKLNDCEISVRPFDNLLMHFAEEVGAAVIVRGLRAASDFEFEFQMVGMNERLNPDIETIFLMATDKYQFIASRLVKEIARLDGDISQFVTPTVAKRLYERYKKK
jgi:pantetheine-phosphate adenylyltransferase